MVSSGTEAVLLPNIVLGYIQKVYNFEYDVCDFLSPVHYILLWIAYYCSYLRTFQSDFYVYDIENNKWTLITEDTGMMGGPQLIFDHQMSMDVAKRTIYVFGGRVLTPPAG